jgi:hypothetical protein
MKPGSFRLRPVGAHFIGLPGNPVSSFVTFVPLVRPFLLKLQGATRFAPLGAVAGHFDWPRPDKRRDSCACARAGDWSCSQPEFRRAHLHGVWASDGRRRAGRQTIARGDAVRLCRWRSCWHEAARALLRFGAGSGGAGQRGTADPQRDAGRCATVDRARRATGWRCARPRGALALDQIMSDEGAVLREACEVAFFPPVTGG